MIFLLPLTLSWFAGAALLMLDGRKRWVSAVATVVLAIVLGVDLVLLAELELGVNEPFEVTTGGWPAGVGIRLYVDRLALLFASLCSGVLTALMLHEVFAGVGSRLLPALVLLMSTGLHGAFMTGDLFNFYVFFELSIVTSFALAAYGYGRAEVRGTFIYVAVNLLGSVLFLLAVASIYHTAGTLDLELLAERGEGQAQEERSAMTLAGASLFAALALKLGLFPFHGWLPVLYSHARPAVVAALAGALANIGAYGLLRIGFTALDDARLQASALLVALGAAATIYGAVLAVHRTRPAELAAYLSIVHAGHMVLGFGIGGVVGITAVLFTVLAGSIDKALMFLSLDTEGGTRRLVTLVAAASAAGLPLTLGFLSKTQLLNAALAAPAAAAVVSAFLLGAALTIAAAFRFWRLTRDASPVRRGTPGVVLILALVTLVLGVVPEPVATVTASITSELIGNGP